MLKRLTFGRFTACPRTVTMSLFCLSPNLLISLPIINNRQLSLLPP